MTVGFREVEAKRREWRKRADGDTADFLASHVVPTILGPKGRHYVTDHHHLVRALMQEGVEKVTVMVIADLSMLSKDSFWVFIDNKALCHPYNEDGKRCPFSEIPKSMSDLKDDPYRSLAGELRRGGGFAKDTTPFSEFLWADFLRSRIKVAQVMDDFDKALAQAMTLAKSKDAGYLPGWCGPHSNGG
jgi:hypothetical protein